MTPTVPLRATATRRTVSLPAPTQRGRVALYLRLSVADLEDGERDVSAGIERQQADGLMLARRRGLPDDAVVRLHTAHDAAQPMLWSISKTARARGSATRSGSLISTASVGRRGVSAGRCGAR